MSIKQRRPLTAVLSVAAATSALMAGCTSTGSSILGDKVDYRTAGSKVVSLDVPPDLSKLPGQSRYGQLSPAIVSANSMNIPNVQQATESVAPGQIGEVKLQRDGQTRWLSLSVPPEQVWDQVRSFWTDAGFELVEDQPAAGLMETNWLENRAKLPQDIIRKTVGTILDGLYDTGERDQFKTRIERTAKGCEIYITHRGLIEEYTDSRKEETRWVPRSDPALESEMLARLMVRLGASKEAAEQAKQASAKPTPAAGYTPVRMADNQSSLTVDDDFETVWRRVGLALDRKAYTIESRDRIKGVYEVRLPGAGKEAPKPGLWARLFGKKADTTPIKPQRILVRASGTQTTINVVDDRDQTQDDAAAKRIAKDLFSELS